LLKNKKICIVESVGEMENIMKTKELVLKIVSAVLCALTIVPLFLNYITLRNGDSIFSYTFANTSGSGDTLLVISRILFITTVVVPAVLLVGIVLQFFFKNDILNWVVVGAGVFILITASLSFVSTLLYCLSISEFGKYVWFPSIGCYLLLAFALAAPIVLYVSNLKKATK
jgi:hypothetical protein